MASGSLLAADAVATSGIEEVTVTARKTSESAQVVPVSVKAFSASDLEKNVVLTVSDLMKSVPGLFVAPNSQGGAPTFAIRAAKADNGTSDTVTSYIDDVPVASTKSIANMMYDMQSISVLKGPQGTLFGAATTGGAIIFRPEKPSANFEAYLEAGIGNYGRKQLQGMVNVPVNDVLQLRIAGESVRRDGFSKNNPAPSGAYNGIRDYANDKHDSLRVTARLKPNAAFQNDLELDYFKEDDQPNQAIPIVLRPRYSYQTFLGFPLTVDYAKAGIKLPSSRDNLQLSPTPTWNKAKIWNAFDTATYEIDGQTSLKAVLGYQNVIIDTSEQNGGVRNTAVDGRTAQKIDQWTFEPSFDFKSSDGKFRNKTGLYFSDRKQETGNAYKVIGLPFDGSTDPTSAYLVGIAAGYYPLETNHYYTRKTKSSAVYSQFSYDLSKELTATLGMRYSRDSGDYKASGNLGFPSTPGYANSYGDFRFGNCNPGDLIAYNYDAATCTGTETYKSSAPSFNFTLDNKLSERAMVYATVRSGYLVGGFNNSANPKVTGVATTFTPEKVVDFETGFKSDWSLMGRPVRTNLAAFYGSYKNQQRVQNGTTASGSTFIGVVNAGSSTFYGFDFDGVFKVTDNLELSASWNHIETAYSKFNAIVSIPGKYAYVDLSGQPMAQTPKDVINVGATVKWPVGPGVGLLKSTLSGFRTAKTFTADSPTFAGTTNASGLVTSIDPAQDFREYGKLPAYSLLNFSTTWKGIMGSNFDANLWVKNLTDKQYYTYTSNQMLQFGYATRSYGNPRELGLNVRYNF
jgi:outer membrane receptor protein involved in Fe transport